MRILLAFLLVACVMSQVEVIDNDKSEALDFMTGLLQGIGETGDVNNLEKCMKDLKDAFDQIKAALAELKKINIMSLISALPKLFRAVKTIMNVIQPCSEGLNTLKRLISAIARPDIRKIATRILSHSGEFLQYVQSAISGFQSKDFKTAGKGVGSMLKLMLLDGMEDSLESSATDFLKGFVQGIGETGEVENLLKCMKDAESIFAQIKEALETLKHINLQNLIKGLTTLFIAVRELMAMLKPCSEGFNMIKKLIQAVAHPNLTKIATKILMHSGAFLKNVNNAITGFSSKDYTTAGKGVGGILKIIFL